MTNAEFQQQRFWDLFNKELEQQGNPFIIRHRKHYATINKRSSDSGFCLGLDFLYKKELVRVGIYMLDNVSTFDTLLAQKDTIEEQLGFIPNWTTSGDKNPNLRRIEVLISLTADDEESYLQAIRLAIIRANQFKSVIPQYLTESLFDF